jgi:hypothetical protein
MSIETISDTVMDTILDVTAVAFMLFALWLTAKVFI